MNQLIAVALGGAFGAVVRFLMSSGLYHWLGRGFPYGTLAVNVVGSFLIGLLTEALFMQRVTLTFGYRAAILIGFIGAFTTYIVPVNVRRFPAKNIPNLLVFLSIFCVVKRVT